MEETLNGNAPILPYVVSSDVETLAQKWASAVKLVVPDHRFFDEQEAELKGKLTHITDSPIEVVSSTHLIDGITKMAAETSMHIVSMDRAYITEEVGIRSYVDVTRAVNEELDDLGIFPRPRKQSIDQQVEQYRTSEPTPMCLVDDVLYEGNTMKDMINRFAEVNRPVHKVIVGIGIQAGINEIEKINDGEIEVACVETYADVVDEVCERDFVAGSPMSGRTLIANDGTTWSVPYFPEYGKAEWASIPDHSVEEFSQFGYSFSANFWEQMEHVNGIQIPTMSVPRPIRQLISSPSFAAVLREHSIKGPGEERER